MASSQRGDLSAAGGQERIGSDHKSASTPFGQGREGFVDLTVSRGVKDKQRLPEGAHGGERIGRLRRASGLLGFTSSATTAAFGTSSCSKPKPFEVSSALNQLIPVRLPPGRLRLATRPTLTGSTPLVNTIGIVAVDAFAASAALLPPVAAIAATPRRTKSVASTGNRSFW